MLIDTDAPTEAAVVAGLAEQAATLKLEVDTLPGHDHPFALVPSDRTLTSLEKYLPRPLRRQASAAFQDVRSFVGYVTRFRTDSALVTAVPASHRIAAVLDYHEGGPDGLPSWREHDAALDLQVAPEWKAWTSCDKKHFNQTDFAEFLEQNIADIAEPDGAALKEAALKLQVNRSVKVASAINLTTGESAFTYEDQANNTREQTKLPKVLVLGLPVYRHGARYRLEASLRFRLNDGKLTFFYVLQRPDKIADAAFDGVLDEIEKGLGERPLLGTAR